MLAENNRGIINAGLYSKHEFSETPRHVHTNTQARTRARSKESNQSVKLPYLLHMKIELQKLAHLFWTIRVIEV